MILMVERNHYGIVWTRMWRGSNAHREHPNVQHGHERKQEGSSNIEASIRHGLAMLSYPYEIHVQVHRKMMDLDQRRMRCVERQHRREQVLRSQGGATCWPGYPESPTASPGGWTAYTARRFRKSAVGVRGGAGSTAPSRNRGRCGKDATCAAGRASHEPR